MKSVTVSTVVASLLFAGVCTASEIHDADKALETTLRTALNQRHVHIHAHHGVVTLEGKVPTEADRETIESVVRGTTGVVAVKDKLRVTFPTPATSAAYPPSIPIYGAPPPEVPGPAPVVTVPPVVVPDYPKLKVQAWTDDDLAAANRIARQLRRDALPATGLDDVTIMVRNGAVSLRGTVETQEGHDAIIAAVQRAGGVKAIYDQLQTR